MSRINSTNRSNDQVCDTMNGMLPSCAPLAVPYVPFQQENSETYAAPKGIVRGTMYPGLDLPFRNMVNTQELSPTAMHQLQAASFAITELGLYLDTHQDDQEAVNLFNQYVEAYSEMMQKYENMGGGLNQMDSALSGKYTWLSDPWPWEYCENMEG